MTPICDQLSWIACMIVVDAVESSGTLIVMSNPSGTEDCAISSLALSMSYGKVAIAS